MKIFNRIRQNTCRPQMPGAAIFLAVRTPAFPARARNGFKAASDTPERGDSKHRHILNTNEP